MMPGLRQWWPLVAVLILLVALAGSFFWGRIDMARQIEAERLERAAQTAKDMRRLEDESSRLSDESLCRRLTGFDC